MDDGQNVDNVKMSLSLAITATSWSLDVSDQLIRHFGDKVYKTKIPRNVRLAEAPSFGVPAMYHDRNSAGAKAYCALAAEIIAREGDRPAVGTA